KLDGCESPTSTGGGAKNPSSPDFSPPNRQAAETTFRIATPIPHPYSVLLLSAAISGEPHSPTPPKQQQLDLQPAPQWTAMVDVAVAFKSCILPPRALV